MVDFILKSFLLSQKMLPSSLNRLNIHASCGLLSSQLDSQEPAKGRGKLNGLKLYNHMRFDIMYLLWSITYNRTAR